jgi:hypothetical protein
VKPSKVPTTIDLISPEPEANTAVAPDPSNSDSSSDHESSADSAASDNNLTDNQTEVPEAATTQPSDPKPRRPKQRRDDTSGFDIVREKRLCVPYHEFLDKAVMGQRHQLPTQNSALKAKAPDELASCDTVMHVWDILQDETDHPTLYKVRHITGFTDENNANVTYYRSTYRRVEMWEVGARHSPWTRAVEAKEVLPIT